MHIFLVCARKSQDIAQSQKNFARSQDRMTARFRNFDCVGTSELKWPIFDKTFFSPVLSSNLFCFGCMFKL